ncbi:hypothetical protein LWI28_019050 [Acer negundo]|uniref:DUF4218 domain-containing protein n=1 Tax=Acer negundo TaxID=4023 RepID=A0AAD5IAU3_ACENE|nr:hypothetical protein LWI28_019050 [Acer negundo]
MKVLKGYVHNRNCPEGCIAECYIAEEAMEFCTEYLSDLAPIEIPHLIKENVHLGKPQPGGYVMAVDRQLVDQAYHYVLENSAEVRPYIEHKLTFKYILPFKAKPEILEDHPAIYNFIKKDHWDQFVASRLSEKFTKTRKKQQKKQKKNKYDHTLSRKGYVGLIEELDQLMQQYDEGSLQQVNSQDVLTMALGTLEHFGRVRGMGHCVTKRMYFDLTSGRPAILVK